MEPQGMDSFEFNKIAGAVLGTLLFVMGLGIFSDALFARTKLAKPGYDLPAAAEGAEHGAPAAATAPSVPLPDLLAKADPAKGAALAKQCATCHTLEEGAAPKPTGPDLAGVVGRKMGSTSFGGYSDSMKGMGKDWTYDDLNTFITKPSAYVPGTKMGYAGEKDPAKRADIIAFLKSISPKAPPLPQAAAK
jgi:cytochrome c